MPYRSILTLLIVLLPTSPAVARSSTATRTWSAEEIAPRIAEVHHAARGLTDRIERISALFLGVPYRASPLGEGPGAPIDPDPLIRFDGVDCVTFLEEVMALTYSPDLTEATRILNTIRYHGGQVEYRRRNHFPMAQWIPENLRQGYLRDITREVAGDRARTTRFHFTLDKWNNRHRAQSLHLRPEDLPLGTHRLPIIPFDQVATIVDRIPSGTILSLVRVESPFIPHRISHQGLVVVKGGKRYLRHASGLPYRRVVDEPLDHFLERTKRLAQWPLAGINLLAVQPRPTALPAQSSLSTP